MKKELKRIASFTVNHDYITEGMYISRIDGDITTYDLRTRMPNCDSFMENAPMHTAEHLFATYVRNSSIGDRVIYFGPMGCQTGFYLLVRDSEHQETFEVVKSVLRDIVAHEGEIPGVTKQECGNYKSHDLAGAKREFENYLKVLEKKGPAFEYPTE